MRSFMKTGIDVRECGAKDGGNVWRISRRTSGREGEGEPEDQGAEPAASRLRGDRV